MAKRLAFVVSALTGEELTGGTYDASRVYTLLLDQNLGICDPKSSKPLHECSTRNEFMSSLMRLLQDWTISDQLVFYYTGHGKIRNEVYCLAFGNNPVEYLPFDSLINELGANGVSRAILILDACHAGAAIAGGVKSVENSLNPVSKSIPRGIATITSCRATQKSFELPDGSASVFTHLLCEGIETGLKGTATDDGFITVSDIVDFIQEQLNNDDRFSATPQSPVYSVHGADREIWLSKNKSGAVSPATLNQMSSMPAGVFSLEELRVAYENTVASRHPCAGATLDDLDWDIVQSYAGKSNLSTVPSEVSESFLSGLGFFSPLSPQGQKQLHKAAALCFCRNPENFIPQATANFIAGDPGQERFSMKEVTGPLSGQFERLTALTFEQLFSVSDLRGKGLRRDQFDIPDAIVRELISNAVAHRDYEGNGCVQVAVNDDYLEVRSPGRFPKGTTWETFISNSRVSCPKDPAIALYLKRLLALEGVGRGFTVIQDYIKENGREAITCTELPGPTTLIRVRRNHKRPSYFEYRPPAQTFKVLFLSSNPFQTTRLKLDEEVREITAKISATGSQETLKLIAKLAVRPDDLLQYLNEYRPHIVHFSGHGLLSEEIILEDKFGQPKAVTKPALVSLFQTLRDNIRLVFLNACYSRPQAEAITEVVDFAIGMKRAVGDVAAITFAASFYRAIGFGRSVREAFDQGRIALSLEGIPEENAPELFVRSGVDPEKVFLLQITQNDSEKFGP